MNLKLFFMLFLLCTTSILCSEKEVIVVNNGWHSGLVFKIAEIDRSLWPQSSAFSDFAYIETGWGDEAFYQSRNPGLWYHLKAAFWPTPSVLHVRGYDSIEKNYSPSQIYVLKISKKRYDRICRYIEKEYAKEEGKVLVLGEGLFPNSLFYKGSQPYHIARTCNVWTAKALKEADIPIIPLFSITTENLFEQLHSIKRE